jgi:hypothetical protein
MFAAGRDPCAAGTGPRGAAGVSNELGRLGFVLLHDTQPQQKAGEKFCTMPSVELAEVSERLGKLWGLSQEDHT